MCRAADTLLVTRVPFYLEASFKALERKWDKKLADSGFVDIEHRQEPDGREKVLLKGHQSAIFRKRYSPEKAEYYRIAAQWVRRLETKPSEVREAWLLHSDGCFNTEIAETLKLPLPEVNEIVEEQAEAMLFAYKTDGEV